MGWSWSNTDVSIISRGRHGIRNPKVPRTIVNSERGVLKWKGLRRSCWLNEQESGSSATNEVVQTCDVGHSPRGLGSLFGARTWAAATVTREFPSLGTACQSLPFLNRKICAYWGSICSCPLQRLFAVTFCSDTHEFACFTPEGVIAEKLDHSGNERKSELGRSVVASCWQYLPFRVSAPLRYGWYCGWRRCSKVPVSSPFFNRPFSFSDSSLVGPRPFSLPLFFTPPALSAWFLWLFVVICGIGWASTPIENYDHCFTFVDFQATNYFTITYAPSQFSPSSTG